MRCQPTLILISLNFMITFYFNIRSPTHFCSGQNSNLLDFVFTNEEDIIITDTPVGKSDHCMLEFEYLCYLNNENNSSECFSYLKGDYQGFITSLKDLDWDSLLAKTLIKCGLVFLLLCQSTLISLSPRERLINLLTHPYGRIELLNL